MPTLGSWACEPCVHEKQGPGQAKTVGPDGQGPMVAHAQPQPSRPCAPRRAANCTTGAAPTWAIGHVSPRPGPADASKVHLAWAVLGYTNWASKHAGLAASTSEPTQNPAASGAAGSAAGTATAAKEVGRGTAGCSKSMVLALVLHCVFVANCISHFAQLRAFRCSMRCIDGCFVHIVRAFVAPVAEAPSRA